VQRIGCRHHACGRNVNLTQKGRDKEIVMHTTAFQPARTIDRATMCLILARIHPIEIPRLTSSLSCLLATTAAIELEDSMFVTLKATRTISDLAAFGWDELQQGLLQRSTLSVEDVAHLMAIVWLFSHRALLHHGCFTRGLQAHWCCRGTGTYR
jgi:hypothetical protein